MQYLERSVKGFGEGHTWQDSNEPVRQHPGENPTLSGSAQCHLPSDGVEAAITSGDLGQHACIRFAFASAWGS
jgi:hypothetical protein